MVPDEGSDWDSDMIDATVDVMRDDKEDGIGELRVGSGSVMGRRGDWPHCLCDFHQAKNASVEQQSLRHVQQAELLGSSLYGHLKEVHITVDPRFLIGRDVNPVGEGVNTQHGDFSKIIL